MDLRTERTKRSIINAFIELRSKKSLEKITIKELSELAFINKATFYSHYKDIYDLSEQLEDEAIASLLRDIPHPDKIISDPRQGVTELALAMHSQSKLFNTLFSDTRASILSHKLEVGIKEKIYAMYPQYQNDLEWDILISLLVKGSFHAFYSHSEDATMEELISIIANINECLIRNKMNQTL